MFDKIEEMLEYRNLMRLFKEDEKAKKGKKTISALELQHLNTKRLVMMHNMVKPLKERLADHLCVKNIYLSGSSNDNIALNINFIKEGNDAFLVIDNPGFDEYLNIIMDSSNGQYHQIIENNKKMIKEILQQGNDSELCDNIRLMSTSNLFSLDINLFKYLLCNRNAQSMDLVRILHELNPRDNSIRKDYYARFRDIDIKLQDDQELKRYLEHIKFYEDAVPKSLIKKR